MGRAVRYVTSIFTCTAAFHLDHRHYAISISIYFPNVFLGVSKQVPKVYDQYRWARKKIWETFGEPSRVDKPERFLRLAMFSYRFCGFLFQFSTPRKTRNLSFGSSFMRPCSCRRKYVQPSRYGFNCLLIPRSSPADSGTGLKNFLSVVSA